QEFTQSRAEGTPSYVVVSTDGPPHDPIFTVVVKLEGKPLAEGSGKSKKAAEQEAAKLAFQALQDPTRSVVA
ncbi:MAG: ribonuclease III, partial [Cyanobacteria bacterium PR.023]|nr:ribonuclease III [Cyanobacteria bacterium PR.023]